MVEHIRITHGQPLFCNFCDFQAVNRGDLAKHTFECHEDQTLLNTISGQVSELAGSLESLELFKEDVSNAK